LSDHAERNRAYWTTLASGYAERAPRNWDSASEPNWGIFRIPESEVRALPDVTGRDVIELGCGTGYFSAWLARLGARPVAVDITEAQLETARAMQRRFGAEFQLIHASAEDVPLPDGSFDVALSEYGASIWCDPYRWIPEAARLLRPGGDLVFLRNSTIVMLCSPDEDVPAGVELVRDYFGLGRIDWAEDPPSVEFHLGYGDWIRLLRSNGFEVLDLIELQAPEGAETDPDMYVTAEWARRWPAEEIWVARKIG